MEDISDEEVQVLASNWVKRIQNSILTPADDVNNFGVVRTQFGSNDEGMHSNHEFCEENGKIDHFNSHLRSIGRPDSSKSLSFKQLPVVGGGSGVIEQHDSFERTSKQSNIAHSSKVTDEGDDISTTGKANSKSTPRVDVSFLRQKRLAFFDSNLTTQEEGDFLHDKNRNILTNITASHSPPREAHSSSCIDQFDLYPLKSNGHATQVSLDEMYHLQSLETTPLSSRLKSGSPRSNNVKYPYRSPRVSELDEEEDFKLELWGLKEAVNSGDLDLNVYLKKPAWKDHSFSSFADSTAPHQLGKNCDLQPCGKHPTESFDPLHEKTKPITMPDSGVSNHSYFYSGGNRRGKIGKEIDDVDDGCYSKEHRTSCMPMVHAEEVSNTFNGPEPQINGPLYSGFETSDSESSLLSFGSKCDDVHYRKAVKKQDRAVVDERISWRGNGHSASKKQANKLKPKRGKDKILMELTEFMEGSGTPKDTRHSKQNSSSNDLHLKCPADAGKVVNGDHRLATLSQGHLQNGFAERHLNGDPTCKNSICDGDVALSYDDHNQTNGTTMPAENQGSIMGKVCPKCGEVNSKAANWCIECGTALICIKASCLTAQQQQNFEKQCLETQALIKETLKTPTNLSHVLSYDKAAKEERSLSRDISNLSLQVSQSTSNLDDEKYSSSPRGYKRRWMRSSIAWSTYHSSELSKSPSFVKEQGKIEEKQRATSFSDLMTCSSNEKGSNHHKRNSRNKSFRQRTVSCSSFGHDDEATKPRERLTNGNLQTKSTTSLKGSQKHKQNRTCLVQRSSPCIENPNERNERTTKGQYRANSRNGLISIESQSCPSLLKVQWINSIYLMYII